MPPLACQDLLYSLIDKGEPMLNLENRTALLVGTKRMGAVVARRLAQAGVRLALSYRGSKRAAQNLQAELQPLTRTCLVQADVSRPEDVARLMQTVREELGDLSFLVNLASGFPRAPLDSLDAAAWKAAEPVARANYLLAVHASRSMRENPGPTRGHLIFFSDWAAGGTPYRNYLPYLTSKASIDFMTRAFAVELAPHGILVNAIAPGPTMRPPEISSEDWERNVIARTPLRRESAAGEIVEMIVTLLKSETITGETIRIDAGRHLAGPGVD